MFGALASRLGLVTPNVCRVPSLMYASPTATPRNMPFTWPATTSRNAGATPLYGTTSASIFDIALNHKNPISWGLPGPREPNVNQPGCAFEYETSSGRVFIGTCLELTTKTRGTSASLMTGSKSCSGSYEVFTPRTALIANESKTMPNV